ncbi:MAG: hypothetical protein P8168_13465 [Deltaproteobacteria bacterium]|jgi:hypothetical protein
MTYLIPGVILVVLVILLAVPVSLGYDSPEPWLRIKWLGLSLRKRLGRVKPKKLKKTAAKKRVSGRAALARLWSRRELCRELIQPLRRLVLEVLKTLSFRDSRAAISLPDPALNGLLFAFVANIPLEQMDLSVNFENRNFAQVRVKVYPYRIASKLTSFLLHLHYLRLVRFSWELYKAGSKSDQED